MMTKLLALSPLTDENIETLKNITLRLLRQKQ